MKYCIERICPTGDVSEEFGDYSDEKEANRNAATKHGRSI